MNSRMRLWVGGTVVVLCLLAYFVFRPKPDDASQIKSALQSALKATKEARPGGVVEYLSSDVVVNGQHYNVNRQFTSFIRKYHPDITVGDIQPKIDGDNATVTSDVHFSVLGRDIDLPQVTFTFQKQHDTKWLVFPSQDWKVTGATAPEQGYEQIVGDLMMGGDF